MNTFNITAEKFPSKRYAVTLREPLYKDRREANRRYPTGSRPGYSVEELLMASCILQIEGVAANGPLVDPINLLKELPHQDGQFLLQVFTAAFMIDDDLSDDARQLTDEFKRSLSDVHTIPKDRMPGQQFSLTFQVPSMGHRIETDRSYPGKDSGCGYSLEDLLFVNMIHSIDGQPIDKPGKDKVSLMDNWALLDYEYALACFLNMATIERTELTDARELGKSHRARGSVKTSSTAKKGTASRPAAPAETKA